MFSTPSGPIQVTVQPWTPEQRATAVHEIRQIVDSLTAAFLRPGDDIVCARSDGPLAPGDEHEVARFREFLTLAPKIGQDSAYEQVYGTANVTGGTFTLHVGGLVSPDLPYDTPSDQFDVAVTELHERVKHARQEETHG
ncbi:hypothetical protein [Nocardia gipuzkoensis]|uniref:hypothetical protein n=1 Tax=Nocardia gipuzkoensis TaxID=2749991 RepID=UPI0015EF8F3F|nr:hypothetical protein [Nocardia gipuzkoensis]